MSEGDRGVLTRTALMDALFSQKVQRGGVLLLFKNFHPSHYVTVVALVAMGIDQS